MLERGYGNVEVTFTGADGTDPVTHKLTAHRYRQVWTNKPINGKQAREKIITPPGETAEVDTQVPNSPIIWHVLGDKKKAVGEAQRPLVPGEPPANKMPRTGFTTRVGGVGGVGGGGGVGGVCGKGGGEGGVGGGGGGGG